MARSSKVIKSKLKKNSVTLEFKQEVKKFMDEHADVLRKLAKR